MERSRIFRRARSRPLARYAVPLLPLSSMPVYAQSAGSDPWDNAVNVLKTAFTRTIATTDLLMVLHGWVFTGQMVEDCR